jgi:hypothetical protein
MPQSSVRLDSLIFEQERLGRSCRSCSSVTALSCPDRYATGQYDLPGRWPLTAARSHLPDSPLILLRGTASQRYPPMAKKLSILYPPPGLPLSSVFQVSLPMPPTPSFLFYTAAISALGAAKNPLLLTGLCTASDCIVLELAEHMGNQKTG